MATWSVADAKRFQELEEEFISTSEKAWHTKLNKEAACRSNAQESGAGGNDVKKVVSPEQKKRAVKEVAEKGLRAVLVGEGLCSSQPHQLVNFQLPAQAGQ